jgi:hypothetical protein
MKDVDWLIEDCSCYDGLKVLFKGEEVNFIGGYYIYFMDGELSYLVFFLLVDFLRVLI